MQKAQYHPAGARSPRDTNAMVNTDAKRPTQETLLRAVVQLKARVAAKGQDLGSYESCGAALPPSSWTSRSRIPSCRRWRRLWKFHRCSIQTGSSMCLPRCNAEFPPFELHELSRSCLKTGSRSVTPNRLWTLQFFKLSRNSPRFFKVFFQNRVQQQIVEHQQFPLLRRSWRHPKVQTKEISCSAEKGPFELLEELIIESPTSLSHTGWRRPI